MKTYLNSYNEKKLGGYFTNGDSIYELQVTEVSWWGLVRKNKTIDYTISWNQNNLLVFENWEGYINSNTPLPNNRLKWYQELTCVFILLGYLIWLYIANPICWIITALIYIYFNVK